MRHARLLIATAAVLGAGSAAQATTYTLTFDANVACGAVTCTNFTPIDQGYGDTPLVDVSYQSVANPGESDWIADVFYWDTGYGDLTGNAWGGLSDTQGATQIIFKPAAGYKVTLISLDMAGWLYTDRDTQSFLYDGNYNVVGLTGPFTAPGTGHLTLTCAAPLCTQSALVLEWGPNGYNAGVDNVVFSVNAVPEPASWALMIAGFGMVGGALRRRTLVAA